MKKLPRKVITMLFSLLLPVQAFANEKSNEVLDLRLRSLLLPTCL